MAASNFTDLYNYGQYGYMGIGPMPAYSFTLTLSVEGVNDSFWLGSSTSTHIVAYNPTNTAQYAVYSGESFSVYSPNSGSYMLVTDRPQMYPGVPSSQSIDISNKASDWEFHGLASLEGAALCIATNASGNGPDGHDYGAISNSQKTWFTYEKIVVLMADKINGRDIYAKRAEQDKDGNDIVSVPSSTSADENKVLTVDSSGNAVWATAQGGSGSVNEFFDWATVTASDIATCLTNGHNPIIRYAFNSDMVQYAHLEAVESSSGGTSYEFFTPVSGTADNGLKTTTRLYIPDWSTKTATRAMHVSPPASSQSDAGKVLTVNSNGSQVWGNVPTELPSLTGNGGKVLAVNSGATATEWINSVPIEVVASMPASPTSGVLYIVTGS